MIGATILTAFNDNAAVTYLASLVPGFSDALKYVVMAGAVTGGGLTVIANSPNPAENNRILASRFGEAGILPALPFSRSSGAHADQRSSVYVASLEGQLDKTGVCQSDTQPGHPREVERASPPPQVMPKSSSNSTIQDQNRFSLC